MSRTHENLIEIFQEHLVQLAPFMHDPRVQEIMVNSPSRIFVEKEGKTTQLDFGLNPDNVRGALTVLTNLASKQSASGEIPPYIDARQPGFRFAAVLSPYSIHGDAICIRKHTHTVRPISQYRADGLLDRKPWPPELRQTMPNLAAVKEGGEALERFFIWLMETRKNVLVSGGTSTGKTTFTNGLLQLIPDHRRLVILEDTAELLLTHPNIVQIECNDEAGLSMQRGVKLQLRFRPDHPIVGEVRDETAFDLLDLANTGHPGLVGTLHADTDEEALYRIEDLARQSPKAEALPLGALRRKIARAINFVIQASRYEFERFPISVLAVKGVDEHDRYITEQIYFRYY